MVVRSFSHDNAELGSAVTNAMEQATLATSASSRAANTPHVHHATASRVVKGEDVLFVHPLSIPTTPQSMMYMVCDGHSGVDAADFVASNFLRILNMKMPTALPNFGNSKEVKIFAESVRKALCETFVRLDNEWANLGHMAGTTVTVLLCTGWLMTIANTGDSATVLDTGCSVLELTCSHRIQSNLDEQTRLQGAGQLLAPLGFHLQGPAKDGEPGVGPLRLWPGGLCVSRSIGDLDAGPEVVPIPHVRQVLTPSDGCRVIMASDGLWDVLTFTKAVKLTRSKPTAAAASALVAAVSRDLRTMDDASIVVVDVLPTESTSFPSVALKSNPQGAERPSGGGGGLFGCFKSEPEELDSRDTQGPGHLGFYCDVDCLRAYPGLKQLLVRTTMGLVGGPPIPVSAPQHRLPGAPVDYTMHGSTGAYGYPNGTAPQMVDSSPDGTLHSMRMMSMEAALEDDVRVRGAGLVPASSVAGGLYSHT